MGPNWIYLLAKYSFLYKQWGTTNLVIGQKGPKGSKGTPKQSSYY